jgi:ligand-binding sensor protein
MQLLDVCPLEQWVSLENDIYERSGLNASVYDIAGIRINANHHWPNRLCPEIKARPKGQSFICATAHMNIANMARQSRAPVIEECDAGMLKLVVPIFVQDTFIGSAGGCGLLLEQGEVDSFLVNKITEMDEEQVETLAQDIAALTMEKAQELAQFIQQRIEALVQGDEAGRHKERA